MAISGRITIARVRVDAGVDRGDRTRRNIDVFAVGSRNYTIVVHVMRYLFR